MRPPALIRSGWWVAVAAILLSVAAIWQFLSVTSKPPPGDPPPPGAFDLTTATVPRDLIVRVMPPDGLRTLLEPATMAPTEVELVNEEERGKLLVSDDRVIGVAFGGEARAYPLRLMRWHEVVNDVVGGEAIAVTYGPLCDSVAVFSRALGGGIVELGLSGLLYNSNALLYDARVGDLSRSPLWVQLSGAAVAGAEPRSAPPLRPMPATLTTWAGWLERHPDTTVMAPQEDLQKIYKRDPYHSYFGSDVLHYPVEPLPRGEGLSLKDRVVVVDIDGTRAAFALPDLAASGGGPEGAVSLKVNGTDLRIAYRLVPGTAEVEVTGGSGRLQSLRYGFWFAWHAIEQIAPAHVSDLLRS